MAGFRFTKGAAHAEARFLKMGFYGPPGSGKTFTALLCAEGLALREQKRVAFLDTEHGTRFYAQPSKKRRVHPEAFDFDPLYSRSIMEATEAVATFDLAVHGVLVLDSISHIWDTTQESYPGKRTRDGQVPFGAWHAVKRPYKRLIAALLALQAHVIICGRQKALYDDDDKGGKIKVGYGMRAETETEHEPDVLFRFERGLAKEGTVADVFAICEKDRASTHDGATLKNPTYEILAEPYLPMLTGKQHTAIGQVGGKDAEKIADQEREREEQAVALMTRFSARIAVADDEKALGGIAGELTPEVKDQMEAEDVSALKRQWGERAKTLGLDPAKIKATKVAAPSAS